MTGPAWYLAPECDDIDDEYETHTISRPSDIWSLGCVLLEVLTYFIAGPSGVTTFQQRRKIKIGITITYIFHDGRKSKHPAVISWMNALEEQIRQSKPLLIGLLQLIHEILVISASNRPSASLVLQRLRSTYVSLIYNTTLETLKVACMTRHTYELKIEYERFSIGGHALGLDIPANDSIGTTEIFASDSNLENAVDLLKKIDRDLSSATEHQSSREVEQTLAVTNDHLYLLLPTELLRHCQVLLEQRLIAAADVEELREAEELLQTTLPYRRLGLLATIKRVTLVTQSRKTQCRRDLFIEERGMVHAREDFGEHCLGVVPNNYRGRRGRPVFMEFLRYDIHWEGPVTEEMLVRIESIAEMHSQDDKPSSIRSLDCIGYFHQPEKHAFCIVYDFPVGSPESGDEEIEVYSLHDILKMSQNWRRRPLLEDRYNLARTSAVALLEFHTVDWLHKSLSAHNIIFFNREPRLGDTKGEKNLDQIRMLDEPFVVGFSRSRPNEPFAYTNGPGISGENLRYQHPQYADGDNRYRYLPEFDYYSLGIILLEIGLWTPLSSMVTGEATTKTAKSRRKDFVSLEDQRRYLLRSRVPLLGHLMGSDYLAAVRVCIESFGGGENDGERENDVNDDDYYDDRNHDNENGECELKSGQNKRLRFSEEVVAKLHGSFFQRAKR